MMRTIVLIIFSLSGLFRASLSTESGTAAPGETVVKLIAKKFQYGPEQVTVKRGTPVVFEITSEDGKHGFNLPDFGVRADVIPGATTRVAFTPGKSGTFTFACDVFCGSGHEDMSGTLVVVD